MNNRRSGNVAVIGAGVVGLAAANELFRKYPDLNITILHCGDAGGGDVSKNCCSLGPPGIFRIDDERFIPLGLPTLERLQQLHCKYSPTVTGVHKVSGYIISEECVPPKALRQCYERVEDLDAEFLEREFGLKNRIGAFMTTFCSQGRLYVPWLRKEFLEHGGTMQQKTLSSLESLVCKKISPWLLVDGNNYDVIVNCSGFGARTLCNDMNVRPRRGVLLELEAPWIRHFYYEAFDTYLLPGVKTQFLGGYKTLDDWNMSLSQEDINDIWNRNMAVIPTVLQSAEIMGKPTSQHIFQSAKQIGQWVGLRPSRIVNGLETPRIEAEMLRGKFGNKPIKIVHNYGHGGGGFCLSIGSAQKVVQLFEGLWTQAKL